MMDRNQSVRPRNKKKPKIAFRVVGKRVPLLQCSSLHTPSVLRKLRLEKETISMMGDVQVHAHPILRSFVYNRVSSSGNIQDSCPQRSNLLQYPNKNDTFYNRAMCPSDRVSREGYLQKKAAKIIVDHKNIPIVQVVYWTTHHSGIPSRSPKSPDNRYTQARGRELMWK